MTSFNPCCRGLGSETRGGGALFLDPGMGFQSLLSWIGFRDAGRHLATRPRSLGFNPCCRGLGSETGMNGFSEYEIQVVSILVVVDWVQRLHSLGV